jgi:hypothetical protein
LRELVRPYYSPEVGDRLRFDLHLMFEVLLQTTGAEAVCRLVKTLPGGPRGLRYAEDAGRVVCEYQADPDGTVIVRAPVGVGALQSVMTVNNVLVASSWERGTLTIEGELVLESGVSCADAALGMRIQNSVRKDVAITIPVTVSSVTETTHAGGRVSAAKLVWRSAIEPTTMQRLARLTRASKWRATAQRWDLELSIVAAEQRRALRIGAERKPGVFADFVDGAKAASASFFLADETGPKNFSLWEVTSGADLSSFRVKKGRPLTNRMLLALLANGDFGRARGLARRIEHGRFRPRLVRKGKKTLCVYPGGRFFRHRISVDVTDLGLTAD